MGKITEATSNTVAGCIRGLRSAKDALPFRNLNRAKPLAYSKMGYRSGSISRARSASLVLFSRAPDSHGTEEPEIPKGALGLLLANMIETGYTHFGSCEQFDTPKSHEKSMDQT